jgi:Ca2+-transporting ATPase
MAKRNALIKNMQAIEALGQASVIAVDKTGTITKNELMVEKVYVDNREFTVLGSGFLPQGNILFGDKIIDPVNHPELIFAGKIATFCANASLEILENKEIKILGDPTEAALLVFGEKAGFKKTELESEEPQVLDIPFGHKHKFHSTIHRTQQGFNLSLVGAPEAVLSKVSLFWSGGVERIFTKDDKEEILKKINHFSNLGLRVLAFAYHTSKDPSINIENMKDLVFGGLYGMADVLREEVAEAIEEVKSNGIKTIMITGDFTGTAQAIAKQANIWMEGDKIITGSQIEGLTSLQLSKMLEDVSVFGRVLPEHKLSIVEAYKLRGDIIGMTGDGVNDALSLQAAHLGIAMGKGSTDVAKEAADVILLDNNFKSIIAAIEEGRSIYITIKKVVLYLISTSFGEFLSIAGAIVLGLPLPLFPSQILWLNLVTDGFLVVAIGFESNVSLKNARRGTNIVGKTSVVRTIFMGIVMMIGTLVLFSYFYGLNNPKAWTISLSVLAVFQWFNAWNVRSDKESVFRKTFSNKYLIYALSGAAICHSFGVYNPFMQRLLKTVPLGFYDWVVVVSVASSIIFVEELRKIFVRFGK